MKIIINDTTYENVEWSGNILKLTTDMTLSEVEEAFAPSEEEVTFSIYDGDIEVARYYNKGITSMAVSGTNPRVVVVEFNITQITENAEDRLQTSLDDSDGAIEELAAMLAELYDLDIEQGLSDMSQAVATVNAWTDRITTVEQYLIGLEANVKFEDLFGRLGIVEQTLDEMRGAGSAIVTPEPEVTGETTAAETTEEEETTEKE